MLRILGLLLLMFGIGLHLTRQAHYVVPVDSVAVVARGEDVQRIEQPGLRWRFPYIETVGIIPVTRLMERPFDIATRLADGSNCQIAGRLILRIADPVRAYTWRKAQSAGELAGDEIYTEAVTEFSRTVQAGAEAIDPADARAGAVEAWLRDYRSPVHDDGTLVIAAEPGSVSCSQARVGGTSEPAQPQQPLFGEKLPFAQHEPRPEIAADASVYHFVLPEQEVILRDHRRMLIEGLGVGYVITDENAFRETLGERPEALERAEARLGAVFGAALRGGFGALATADLAGFDPYALVVANEGDLAEAASTFGIVLTDLGGPDAGYRLSASTQ